MAKSQTRANKHSNFTELSTTISYSISTESLWTLFYFWKGKSLSAPVSADLRRDSVGPDLTNLEVTVEKLPRKVWWAVVTVIECLSKDLFVARTKLYCAFTFNINLHSESHINAWQTNSQYMTTSVIMALNLSILCVVKWLPIQFVC